MEQTIIVKEEKSLNLVDLFEKIAEVFHKIMDILAFWNDSSFGKAE